MFSVWFNNVTKTIWWGVQSCRHATINFSYACKRFWTTTEDSQGSVVMAPPVVCLPAAAIFFLLHFPRRPVPLVEPLEPTAEVKELEVKMPILKRARPSSATCPVAFATQSIFPTDHLSVLLDFVEGVRAHGTNSLQKRRRKLCRWYLQVKLEKMYAEISFSTECLIEMWWRCMNVLSNVFFNAAYIP